LVVNGASDALQLARLAAKLGLGRGSGSGWDTQGSVVLERTPGCCRCAGVAPGWIAGIAFSLAELGNLAGPPPPACFLTVHQRSAKHAFNEARRQLGLSKGGCLP